MLVQCQATAFAQTQVPKEEVIPLTQKDIRALAARLEKSPPLAAVFSLGSGFGAGAFYAGMPVVGGASMAIQLTTLVIAITSPSSAGAMGIIHLVARVAETPIAVVGAIEWNDEIETEMQQTLLRAKMLSDNHRSGPEGASLSLLQLRF